MRAPIQKLYDILGVNYTLIPRDQASAVNWSGQYNPVIDHINLCECRNKNFEDFTALHELIHWTMRRVNRNYYPWRFIEEAIADIGAERLAVRMGLKIHYTDAALLQAKFLALCFPFISVEVDKAIECIQLLALHHIDTKNNAA